MENALGLILFAVFIACVIAFAVFFTYTAARKIYTLSLRNALPIGPPAST